MGLIYKATNKINNKMYIGKTHKTLDKRIRSHKSSIINKSQKNNKFYLALKKYGINNFVFEVIANNIPNLWLDWCETYFICKLGTKNNGYNSTFGGLTEKNISKIVYNRIPWNKGLTVNTDIRVKNNIEKTKETVNNRPKRSPKPKNPLITKEFLEECFLVKGLTRKQVAQLLGTNERIIKKWKQIWKILSISDGRFIPGNMIGKETRFIKGHK